MDVRLNSAAFREVFSARVQALGLIDNSLHSETSLSADIRLMGERLVEASRVFELGDTGRLYEIFGKLVVVYSRFVDWKFAIKTAEPDADRYRRSAELLLSEIPGEGTDRARDALSAIISAERSVMAVSDLAAVRDAFSNTPLEISFDAPGSKEQRELEIAEAKSVLVGPKKHQTSSKKQRTTVAFVSFEIDGLPAGSLNYLEPKVAHDLTLELRVTHWPEGAEKLRLMPISVEDTTSHDLPEFSFSKPDGEGPHSLKKTGRAILNVAHSIGSRPYEFKYAAEFEPDKSIRDVEVIGHRTLRIEGVNHDTNPVSGFPNVDRKLVGIRDRLRTFPGLPGEDIANLVKVAAALGNYAAQSLRTGGLPVGTQEREFQERTAEALRLFPAIGSDLEEHPQSGGGITDLSYKGLAIELKAEPNEFVTQESCKKFFDQAVAYAVGYGKKAAIVSVLDSSRKTTPVGAAEDDIELHVHQAQGTTIALIAIIVRCGLAKPSSFSN